MTSRRLRVCLTCAGLLGALAMAAPAEAGLTAPKPAAPASGVRVASLPDFSWDPVARADAYEFQVAADSGFSSPILGSGYDHFQTRNTHATLKKTVPNGTYWWRVRSITATGAVSAWSPSRSLRVAWVPRPELTFPGDGEIISYPATPLVLEWTAVPRAARYRVSIASDPEFSSLVFGGPVETSATRFAPSVLLTSGKRYYWRVVPVDAGNHAGGLSNTRSFVWSWPTWPSSSTPAVTDLADDAEVFDPLFSWAAVPGAAKYELQVFSADQPDLQVCCPGATIATSLSPTSAFKDNAYFWRVRPLDAAGNAGDWRSGVDFEKQFDSVPPVSAPSVKNLRMVDSLGAAQGAGDPTYTTSVPIVRWDPVPGASSYEVEVAKYESPSPSAASICNWTSTQSHWQVSTATTAWTPIGTQWNRIKPFATSVSVTTDRPSLIAGQRYCVRVRAQDGTSSLTTTGGPVYGDYTYLNGSTQPAFGWTGEPVGTSCSSPCATGYLGSADYILPGAGVHVGRMPLFTWRPLADAKSYFVLVAKDPAFHTVVDYAFTQLPAYAPRGTSGAVTYEDESTSYYWAVLPASETNGGFAVGDPLSAAAQAFSKLTTGPVQTSPGQPAAAAGVPPTVTQPPVFQWGLVEGARYYRLQVSREQSFGTLLDDVKTDSSSYTSITTYPSDRALYWRVRGEDEKGKALAWSPTWVFQKRLPAPEVGTSNPASGDMIPVFRWSQVPGAVAYDFHAEQPDGTRRDLTDIQSTAFTATKWTGTGIWSWSVRARFPKSTSGSESGPWSMPTKFTRTIRAPGSPASSVSGSRVLLRWAPKLGAKSYSLQVSSRADFARLVESTTTDATLFAPTLMTYGYRSGGPFYWRVAAVDADRNVGKYTAAQSFVLPPALRVTVRGVPILRTRVILTVTVATLAGRPVRSATVRLSGAGAGLHVHRTSRLGTASFSIRATRHGNVSVRVTKPGYQRASLALAVR